MAYCTIEDLQKFSETYSDNTELVQGYIDAAADIINSYIGYNALFNTYTETLNGTGKKKIIANHANIKTINRISVDGIELDLQPGTFGVTNGIIYATNYVFPYGFKNVEVEYEAGFTNNEIPAIFKQVNIEIANLIQTMSGNNIGITSKSFGSDGSRTFIQNTNYDRYLQNLSTYKL